MTATARQKQVYEFISRYIEAQQQPPTIAEIGRQFKLSSSASVHSILLALEREGLIKRIPNVSRGIELIKQDRNGDDTEIPLLGLVAAGQPIEAILTHETVAAPRDILGPSAHDRASVEAHIPADDRRRAHDGVERGRLPGAVRADQADDLAGPHLERETTNGLDGVGQALASLVAAATHRGARKPDDVAALKAKAADHGDADPKK